MVGRAAVLGVALVAATGLAACSSGGDSAAPERPGADAVSPTSTSTTIAPPPTTAPAPASTRDPFQPQV